MVTMHGAVGSITAERHVRKYLNEDVVNKYKFKLAKDCGSLKAGEEHYITSVGAFNGKYYASIMHGDDFVDVPITRLHKPPIGRAKYSPEAAEDYQIEVLRESLATYQGFGEIIPVKWGRRMYRILGVRKITELTDGKKSKADFALYGEGAQDLLFGSLKAGEDPRDFQHWGGLSDVMEHDAVLEFKEKLHDIIGPSKEFPNRTSIAMDLDPYYEPHLDLIKRSMFGSSYNDKKSGVNNVNLIAGGKIVFVLNPDENWLTLTAPLIIKHDRRFDPTHHPCQIIARYGTDRSNLGIKYCRVGVYPKGSRKIHVTI